MATVFSAGKSESPPAMLCFRLQCRGFRRRGGGSGRGAAGAAGVTGGAGGFGGLPLAGHNDSWGWVA